MLMTIPWLKCRCLVRINNKFALLSCNQHSQHSYLSQSCYLQFLKNLNFTFLSWTQNIYCGEHKLGVDVRKMFDSYRLRCPRRFWLIPSSEVREICYSWRYSTYLRDLNKGDTKPLPSEGANELRVCHQQNTLLFRTSIKNTRKSSSMLQSHFRLRDMVHGGVIRGSA